MYLLIKHLKIIFHVQIEVLEIPEEKNLSPS